MATFREFAKNTSIHGIKYVVLSTTSILEKIFWIIVLITSVSLACYISLLFWERYTSNPTRTLLKDSYAPLNTIPFPGITICNRNANLRNKIDKFLSKLEINEEELLITKKVFSNLFFESRISMHSPDFNITELDVVQSLLDQNDYSDMRRIVRRVSQRCDLLMIRCAWNKKLVPCKDLFEETFTFHGKCCSFNYIRKKSPKPLRHTLHYGLSTGLTVLLKPEYNNKNLAGALAIIHNPLDFPGSRQNVRKHLSLGRVNYLHIDGSNSEVSEEVKKLPISQRRCLYFDENKLPYFNFYSDTNCRSLCGADATYKQCGCVPYYYDYIDDKPICNVLAQPCLLTPIDAQGNPCDCPAECDDDTYHAMMTSSKFVNNPHVWTMDYLEGINETENSILLNIFFTNNRQTIWLRDTMTSEIYLVSSLGGIFSLFLGCSIITLVEILYYTIGKCLIKTVSRNRNKIINKKIVKKSTKVSFKDTEVFKVSKEMDSEGRYCSTPIIPFIN